MERQDGPLVSVVIPTFNSSGTIGQCLKSILNQSYKNIEIIVSDKFSSDNTIEIANRYGAKIVFKNNERSAQKNFGALHAKGSLIYFVDSDFVLEPDVVGRCVESVNGADAVMTINRSRGDGLWARSISYKRRLLSDETSVMAARFFRREGFFKVGGFDESLVAGEDLDIHRRLIEAGLRVKKVDAVEWHIGEPGTYRELILKGYYYGKTLPIYLKKNKGALTGNLNPFKSEYLRGILKEPSLLVLSLIIVQITTYMTTILGFLAKFFARKRI
ncbi:MAG: glycosyltransferase [Nitrososphaerales archaeon]